MRRVILIATLLITVAAVIKKVSRKSKMPVANITFDASRVEELIKNYLDSNIVK